MEDNLDNISLDISHFSTQVSQTITNKLNYYYTRNDDNLSLLQKTKVLDSKVRDIINVEGELIENGVIAFSTGSGAFIHNLFPAFGITVKKGYLVETNIVSKGAINNSSSVTFELMFMILKVKIKQ